MKAGCCLAQLDGDSKQVAGPPDATLDKITHPENAAGFFGRDVAALELKARRFGGDQQVRKPTERVYDVFGDPVAEKILTGIGGQVLERQRRDRCALGQSCRYSERRDHRRSDCRSDLRGLRGPIEYHNDEAGRDTDTGNPDGDQRAPTGKRRRGGRRSDRVNPHRFGNVLDPVPAQWPIIESELVLYLLMGRVRQADSAWSRKGLQTCRDIDAVAIEVVVVGNDDVAEIDSDPQLEMTL